MCGQENNSDSGKKGRKEQSSSGRMESDLGAYVN